MKTKILLSLALVFCSGFALAGADGKDAITSTNLATPDDSKYYGFFGNILYENGYKFGVHFTLEYQSFTLTGKDAKVRMPVRVDLGAESLGSFISKLRDYLDGYIVQQDAKNPKIVHIIEKVLADDPNYALNRKISLNYSGNINGTNIDNPTNGSSTLMGGLVPTVGEQVGEVVRGLGDNDVQTSFFDFDTVVSVTATNQTVRSIFTDCLPSASYKTIMWQAVRIEREGKTCVEVEFNGQTNWLDQWQIPYKQTSP